MNQPYAEEFAQQGYTIIKNLFNQEEVLRLKQDATTIIREQEDVGKTGVFLG